MAPEPDKQYGRSEPMLVFLLLVLLGTAVQRNVFEEVAAQAVVMAAIWLLVLTLALMLRAIWLGVIPFFAPAQSRRGVPETGPVVAVAVSDHELEVGFRHRQVSGQGGSGH